MKHIDDHYKDWCGESHTTNSCHPVHDSAACTDFAEYYRNATQSDNIQAGDVKCGNCGLSRKYNRQGSPTYKCDCGYVFDLKSTPPPKATEEVDFSSDGSGPGWGWKKQPTISEGEIYHIILDTFNQRNDVVTLSQEAAEAILSRIEQNNQIK